MVTVAGAFAILSGRRIGLMQRSTMQEAIAAPKVGGIVRLTGFILKAALVMELAGTALLLPTFSREFGFFQGAWYALFHAVSAFCNAGFDLMGIKALFISHGLRGASGGQHHHHAADYPGGIGFLTWDDIRPIVCVCGNTGCRAKSF